MPTNVIVCGAAGRMGKLLVSLVHETSTMEVRAAIEVAGHWAIGKDAGEVAGIELPCRLVPFERRRHLVRVLAARARLPARPRALLPAR